MKKLLLALFIVTCTTTYAEAAGSKKPVFSAAPIRTAYSSSRSPWDFSAMLGLYNPGTGFGAVAAYRVVDNLLPSANENSLAVEAGFNYISYTSAIGSVGYSVFEIPIRARWDFSVADGKLIVGPIAGFNYQTGSTYSFLGSNYTVGGGLYLQLGGSAIYYFTENFGARAQLAVGGFTTLTVGINYTP